MNERNWVGHGHHNIARTSTSMMRCPKCKTNLISTYRQGGRWFCDRCGYEKRIPQAKLQKYKDLYGYTVPVRDRIIYGKAEAELTR
jgi:ribosomal protein S27AE